MADTLFKGAKAGGEMASTTGEEPTREVGGCGTEGALMRCMRVNWLNRNAGAGVLSLRK